MLYTLAVDLILYIIFFSLQFISNGMRCDWNYARDKHNSVDFIYKYKCAPHRLYLHFIKKWLPFCSIAHYLQRNCTKRQRYVFLSFYVPCRRDTKTKKEWTKDEKKRPQYHRIDIIKRLEDVFFLCSSSSSSVESFIINTPFSVSIASQNW